jgi:hypothetical protein
LPANGWQGCRDDGLVKCGQKHRQHQACQDSADFARGQGRAWRDRRRIADIGNIGGHRRRLGRNFGQWLLVGRSAALPFKLVHTERYLEARLNRLEKGRRNLQPI